MIKIKYSFSWLIVFTLLCASFPSCSIDVTDITLNVTKYQLAPGETILLIANVQPDNATNVNVTWTSNNPNVATVTDNGLVSAITEGNAIITVTTEDGNKTASCDVTVNSILRIVQWCDPQLGFQIDYQIEFQDNYQNGLAQQRRAVELINEIAPDALLIAGDMVHFPDNDNYINAFLDIVAQVDKSIPILFTPGNHDVCTPVTAESLQRYRSFFGDDLQTMERKGYSIISANSILLFGLEGGVPEGVPEEERSLHTSRVKDALQNAKSKNQPIIAMTHYPPYRVEKHYDIRELFVENGSFVWLSGHWHIPWRYTYYHPGGVMEVLVGESTGANSDDFPLGFRLLTIYPDHSFDWDFIPLDYDNRN